MGGESSQSTKLDENIGIFLPDKRPQLNLRQKQVGSSHLFLETSKTKADDIL